MTSPTTTRTLQVCRNCGGGAPVDVHFCPQCSQILTISRHGDYFAFLGVPRRLNLDASELEQRFRALSRQFHPDYFYNATPIERRASLERSSYLNDAYRTLKNPIARVEYLLGLEGFSARGPGENVDSVENVDNPGNRSAGAGAQVPAALLEEVFALNEELDEVRDLRTSGAPPEEWRGKLERARAPIEAKQTAHEAGLTGLSARWDALGVDGRAGDPERIAILTALRECVLERNYINNLLEGIERELTQ
jgi:molecular chaperone HscB